VLGPYDPALVVQTDAGLRVVAPGFARLVQRHDAGIRGIFDGARVAHVRMTRDEARATPGLPHQVTCLALLVLELVAGREPYPLTSEVDYLGAVVAGAREPIDGFVPQLTAPLRRTIEQALLRDPAARPSLTELREALLAEPGVAELRARAATIQ
jgi:hypothetical protein